MMSMSAIEKLKKSEFLLFIDVNEDTSFQNNQYKRIDKSTVLDIAMNPQSESKEYIDSETPTEEVTSNQPELGQEMALFEGNPVFDFLYKKFKKCPVGEQIKVPFLLCFGGKDRDAWQTIASIIFSNLTPTEDKLSFNLKLGPITHGKYEIVDGAPTFTEVVEDEEDTNGENTSGEDNGEEVQDE